MKKITLCLLLIFALVLPGVVLATDIATDVLTQMVAKIGETEYETIAEAIEAVPANGTETEITLLKNVDKGTGFKTVSGQNIVINFNGFTYDAAEPLVGSTGTVTNGCQLKKGSTVTFKNGTLISTSDKAYILIQNYSNLTLDDMIIDATNSTSDYAMSNNNGKVNIIGNTSIKGNKYAFDMCWAPNKGYPEGTQITINTTGTITGDIELGVWGEYSDTDGIKSTLNIENINHIGNIVVSESRLAGQLTITGGTFSSNVGNFVAPYHVCEEVETNKYVVYKQHDITVKYTDGGTAGSDLIRAIEGQKVGLFINQDEGYELAEVIITDELGNQFKTTNQYFTMPNSAVTVEVVFSKIKEEVQQEVQIPDAVEDAEKVEDILLESLKGNEKFEEIIKNNNIEVKVELTEGKVDETRKEEIEKSLKEDEKVAKYLDITIFVKNKDTGVTEGILDQLKEKIKFSVEIPEGLPKVAEGFARKYYIIRNHNGIIEYLDAVLSEDGKNLSFETDKFSAYALAYSDEKITTSEGVPGGTIEEPKEDESVVENLQKEETNTNIPNTGDNIVLYVILAISAILGIIVMKKANTKKNKH